MYIIYTKSVYIFVFPCCENWLSFEKGPSFQSFLRSALRVKLKSLHHWLLLCLSWSAFVINTIIWGNQVITWHCVYTLHLIGRTKGLNTLKVRKCICSENINVFKTFYAKMLGRRNAHFGNIKPFSAIFTKRKHVHYWSTDCVHTFLPLFVFFISICIVWHFTEALHISCQGNLVSAVSISSIWSVFM